MKLKHMDAAQDNAHIEILPLMDVIFCILTFFILGAVGLTRQQAIEQSLPQPAPVNSRCGKCSESALTPLAVFLSIATP